MAIAARRLAGIARGATRLTRAPRPTILLYHRVARVATDPQLLSVTPERFVEQLQLIADMRDLVSLADLVRHRDERRYRQAVAVTFDDGYSDNLHGAKPLLERAGVPATVFVTSGHVGGVRPFWWDELEELLLWPGRLPTRLSVEVGKETLHWELGNDANYSAEHMALRRGWNLLEPERHGPRQELYRRLCQRLRPLEDSERERTLESLRSVAERVPRDDEAPRPLTGEELTRLADGGLVEIGAHTVTHPVLSRLAEGRQEEEVAGSKRALEELIDRPVESFAYPYGGPGDVDEMTVSVVRRTGFRRACATEGGPRRARRDAFRLPRMVVRDWSAAELERRLVGTTS